MLLNSFLIEFISFTFDDTESAGGTFSQTGPEAVTQFVSDHSGFAVYNFKGTFGTGRNTLTAPVAQFFIDFDYFS
jgi:hypothetical protein